jgi:uncharacterized RDD family membrane protein YckC
MTAMDAGQQDDSADRLVRKLVTPEGVDLKIKLASASERASAFFLDVAFIVLSLVALTIILIAGAMLSGFRAVEYMGALWLLGFFFLRVFYFVAFETTMRAATPGKRMLGIRVAARNGGTLSADAIFARNAMRELEIFLPLSFLVTSASSVDAWISMSAAVWCGVFVFFPLFNRDRLRIGDTVAGTWVVHAPKRMLDEEMADRKNDAAIVFDRDALNAYGIRELSVLEDVLRAKNADAMAAVAARIRAKIGWSGTDTSDLEFLSAYYTALRRHLEQRMLFGRRKRDKFDLG